VGRLRCSTHFVQRRAKLLALPREFTHCGLLHTVSVRLARHVTAVDGASAERRSWMTSQNDSQAVPPTTSGPARGLDSEMPLMVNKQFFQPGRLLHLPLIGMPVIRSVMGGPLFAAKPDSPVTASPTAADHRRRTDAAVVIPLASRHHYDGTSPKRLASSRTRNAPKSDPTAIAAASIAHRGAFQMYWAGSPPHTPRPTVRNRPLPNAHSVNTSTRR
jgi:hypothetical protein